MKLYGPIEAAALESLSTDPATSVAGRIYWNSTTLQFMLDSGTSKRALIRNDGKAIFGTDATAANNIRLHHAGQAYLQFVTADDATAENTLSTKLAQVGMRFPNFATTALPAVGNIGRVVFDTTAGTLKVDNGTAWTAIGPIFDTITFTDQSSDPAAVAGKTIFYTKNGSPYKIGSDGLVQLVGAGSSGGAGGYDYFTNGDFESGISTVQYASTALSNGLPSGTGPTVSGTPNSVTISAETAAPIRKTTSLKLTATSTWTAGHGVALGPVMTLQPSDLAKVVTLKCSYQVVSGASGLQFGGAPGTQSLQLAVADVTNGGWIPVPAGALGFNQSTGVGTVTATFQSSSIVGQKYQVFLINAITSTAAVTLLVDEVSLARQPLSYGAAITDFKVTGTNQISATTTAPTKGTIVTDQIGYSRIGDSARVIGAYKQTAAGSTGSGDYLFSLPAGLSFDSTKVVFFNTVIGAAAGIFPSMTLGSGHISGNSPADVVMYVIPYDATRFRLAGVQVAASSGGTNIGAWGSNFFPLSNPNHAISFDFIAPIAGWSSNTQVSSDTDTRVVSAKFGVTASFSATANLPIPFTTQLIDTHSGFVIGGQYRVPVTGIYDVTVSGNSGGVVNVSLYKNAVLDTPNFVTFNPTYSLTGSTTVSAVAGDLLDVRPGSTQTLGTETRLNIRRQSGPSQIAASESVNTTVALTTTTTFGAGAVIVCDIKSNDSHSAYSAGTWTCPVSGMYRLSGKGQSGTAAAVIAKINGANSGYVFSMPSDWNYGGSISRRIQAGQTVQFIAEGSLTLRGLNVGVPLTEFTIERTGN